MEIEVRKSEAKVEREYPYVGKSTTDGQKVLFFNDKTGILIQGKTYNKIGYYSEGWIEKLFTPISKVKKLIIETE